jgi:hypothetical protein
MGMYKKIVPLAGILLVMLVATATAQPIPVSIDKLHLVGIGLLIDKFEPRDFSLFRIGIATVKARVGNETIKVTRGIMIVEDTIYKLNVSSVTNDTFVADIYANDTIVGTLAVSAVLKDGRIVWVGDATINNKDLTVYILEFPRLFRPLEVREKVKEYCDERPSECAGIGPNYCDKLEDHDCRVKIVRWCEHHLDDTRCKALAKEIGKSLPVTPEASTLQQMFQHQVQSRFCTQYPSLCAQTLMKRLVARR